MKCSDINVSVLCEVVKDLVSKLGTFTTMDASTHPKMIESHPLYSNEASYHSCVGRCMRHVPGVEKSGRTQNNGTRWIVKAENQHE